MNIAIEGTVAIKNLGGISEYTRQLIAHLGADTANHYTIATVSLFRHDTNPLEKLPNNFNHRQINLPARLVEASWYFSGRPSLDWWVGQQDVILFPRPLITTSGTRTVAVIHDLSWLILPHLADQSNINRYRQALTLTVKKADHLIAVSGATKLDLIKYFGVPKDRVTVTHLGFDQSLQTAVGQADIAKFRAKFRLGAEPYFLHVGTLEPRKNLSTLVEAFGIFKKKNDTGHKLVLAGRQGWMYQDILETVENSNYRSDIILTGAINENERRCAYGASELVVFPSLYEGFGLPILEGQAAGKPVLTGTGGSLTEIGQGSVLAVDVRSASELAFGLERLALDHNLRRQLISKGQQNLKRFDWTKTATETVKVLEAVVGH